MLGKKSKIRKLGPPYNYDRESTPLLQLWDSRLVPQKCYALYALLGPPNTKPRHFPSFPVNIRHFPSTSWHSPAFSVVPLHSLSFSVVPHHFLPIPIISRQFAISHHFLIFPAILAGFGVEGDLLL